MRLGTKLHGLRLCWDLISHGGSHSNFPSLHAHAWRTGRSGKFKGTASAARYDERRSFHHVDLRWIVPGRLEALRDIIIHFSYNIYSIKLNNVDCYLVHGASLQWRSLKGTKFFNIRTMKNSNDEKARTHVSTQKDGEYEPSRNCDGGQLRGLSLLHDV